MCVGDRISTHSDIFGNLVNWLLTPAPPLHSLRADLEDYMTLKMLDDAAELAETIDRLEIETWELDDELDRTFDLNKLPPEKSYARQYIIKLSCLADRYQQLARAYKEALG